MGICCVVHMMKGVRHNVGVGETIHHHQHDDEEPSDYRFTMTDHTQEQCQDACGVES